jgi:hypothetical protein
MSNKELHKQEEVIRRDIPFPLLPLKDESSVYRGRLEIEKSGIRLLPHKFV